MVDRVLELASLFLRTHGNIMVKMFQSEYSQELIKKWENQFRLLKLSKPRAIHATKSRDFFNRNGLSENLRELKKIKYPFLFCMCNLIFERQR